MPRLEPPDRVFVTSAMPCLTLALTASVASSATLPLHRGDLEGALEVVKGVYLGGTEAAQRAIRAGHAKATDFKWWAGLLAQGLGQAWVGRALGVPAFAPHRASGAVGLARRWCWPTHTNTRGLQVPAGPQAVPD